MKKQVSPLFDVWFHLQELLMLNCVNFCEIRTLRFLQDTANIKLCNLKLQFF